MPPELLSFLNKLSNKDSQQIQWSGFKVDRKFQELKFKFPNLLSSKLLLLAVLLQHLDLSLFTDTELLSVYSLNLEDLNKTSSNYTSKILNTKEPLFDTSSSRIYNSIDVAKVNKVLNSKRTEYFSLFNSENIKELIVQIYNGGLQ